MRPEDIAAMLAAQQALRGGEVMRDFRRGDRMDAETANWLVRQAEKLDNLTPFGADDPTLQTIEAPIPIEFVQISSTTKIAGRYPGHWYGRVPETREWVQQTAVWVDPPNSGTLAASTKYLAKYVGSISPPSGTLTVTGSPTGGTFTITVDGDTTAALAHNAPSATVQAALRLLTGQSATTVSGLPGAWSIVWGASPGSVSVSGSLTGGTSPSVALEPGPSAVFTTELESTGVVASGTINDTETKYECEDGSLNEYTRSKTLSFSSSPTYGVWTFTRCVSTCSPCVDPPDGGCCEEYYSTHDKPTSLNVCITYVNPELLEIWKGPYLVASDADIYGLHSAIQSNPETLTYDYGVPSQAEYPGVNVWGVGLFCGYPNANVSNPTFGWYIYVSYRIGDYPTIAYYGPIEIECGNIDTGTLDTSDLPGYQRFTADGSIEAPELLAGVTLRISENAITGCEGSDAGGACPDGDGSSCAAAINLGNDAEGTVAAGLTVPIWYVWNCPATGRYTFESTANFDLCTDCMTCSSNTAHTIDAAAGDCVYIKITNASQVVDWRAPDCSELASHPNLNMCILDPTTGALVDSVDGIVWDSHSLAYFSEASNPRVVLYCDGWNWQWLQTYEFVEGGSVVSGSATVDYSPEFKSTVLNTQSAHFPYKVRFQESACS